MAKDNRRQAASPQAPLPPIESSSGFERSPETVALEPAEPGDGALVAEGVEGSLPGAIEEVAARLQPTAPGLVVCEVKHGVLRRNGEVYEACDLVELPEAEARELKALGVVSFE